MARTFETKIRSLQKLLACCYYNKQTVYYYYNINIANKIETFMSVETIYVRGMNNGETVGERNVLPDKRPSFCLYENTSLSQVIERNERNR